MGKHSPPFVGRIGTLLVMTSAILAGAAFVAPPEHTVALLALGLISFFGGLWVLFG